MAVSQRLPYLEGEPKSIGIAPPPYKTNSHDDDSTSGRWSDTSFSSSGLGKRRASWTNLVEADENLKNYKVNVYPKVSSTMSTTSYSTNPMPNKLPLSQGVLGGSNTSVNMPHMGAAQPVNYQLKAPSRQGSYTANNSMVSEFFVMPRGSIQKLNYGTPMPPGATPIPLDNPTPLQHQSTTVTTSTTTRRKKNRMQDIRDYFAKPIAKFLCGACCLLLIVGIILAIVLPLNLILPNHYQFSWTAPQILRQQNQAAPGPSDIQLDIQGDQARFNLRGGGAPPFKSNYLSVYDFKTNKIAVVDSSLQQNGKQIICFVMDFDKQFMKDMSDLKRAAKNGQSKNNQTSGWQEQWNFVPSPVQNFNSEANFHPDISECRNARWIQLSFVNSNQKPMKCNECYDFCLPNYGIERDIIRGEDFLNIRKRDCFYLFVPEWRPFAQAYPNNGPGQQQYPQQGNQMPNYGTGTTLLYGQTSPNTLQQPATGGTFMVASNQFAPHGGQVNHLQNHLGQYTQPNPYFGPNTGGGGGGGGGSGIVGSNNGFNTNYNEVNRNSNSNYNNGNRNNNNDNDHDNDSKWIPLSNVPGQILNRTGQVVNQVANQVDQWGRQVGQNLGILPPNHEYGVSANSNANPYDPRYNQDLNNNRNSYGFNNNNNNNNNPQAIANAQRQQHLGSMYGGPGLTGMGPTYNVQQPPVGGETTNGAGFGQPQSALLASSVFNQPEDIRNGIRTGNQGVLPSNPAEYFRNQQQSLSNQAVQLQNQAQQLQNAQAQQSFGNDLSVTNSPNNDRSYPQNWGR